MKICPGPAGPSRPSKRAEPEPISADDEMLAATFDAIPERPHREDEDEEWSLVAISAEHSENDDDGIGLKELERRLDKGKGKQLATQAQEQDEIEDEILPTEAEQWASWPTALDEYKVEDAFANLGEVERGWLMFELALIEPALLVDAQTGFARGVFEDIYINGGVFPCASRMGHDDEGGEGLWEKRTELTVPHDDWLLTLAQAQAIPSDTRDTFMLNLFLIAYPFGQYLLHSFTDSLNQARTLWVATALEAQIDDDEVKKQELWHRYRDERVELEKKLWKALPLGWRRKWELDWTTAPSFQQDSVLGMAGVWAHRPCVDPQLLAFEVDHMLSAGSPSTLALKSAEAFDQLRQLVQLALALVRSPCPVMHQGGPTPDRLLSGIRAHRDMLTLEHRAWLDLDTSYQWDMFELANAARKLGLDTSGLAPWTVRDTS